MCYYSLLYICLKITTTFFNNLAELHVFVCTIYTIVAC